MQGAKTGRFGAPDIVIILVVAAFVAYTLSRIRTGLNYNWNWGVIPQYLFRYDSENDRIVANLLVQGFLMTVRLSVWATILAIVFGTAMGLFRVSASLFKRLTASTYVGLIRNMPPLVLVFIFYYFIGDRLVVWSGIEGVLDRAPEGVRGAISLIFAPPEQISPFLVSVITLGLYEGAYITEIVRGGIVSIEKGQWEAAYALGLSWRQQMRHVILPQTTTRILPPLAGQLISTIKDSAIVSVISIQELTFQGLELMAATYLTFEIWITITLMYFILTFVLSLAVLKLEVAMNKRGNFSNITI